MFLSKLSAKEFIIDDGNWRSHCGPKSDTEEGRGRVPRDWDAQPYGAHPVAKPFDIPLIPRDEWSDRIEEMERTQTRLSDLIKLAGIKPLDQNGTNYCWCNGVVSAMHALQARDMPPQAFVSLSPASVAAQIKGYRNSGGWGGDALEWIAEKGIYSAEEWPVNYWRNAQYKNAEADARAVKRRITEWYDVQARSFEQKMTLLLLRTPTPSGYNWWGHETCGIDPVKIGRDTYGSREWNSWGVGYGENGFFIIEERKSRPDDCIAPRVQAVTFN